mgnify:CR=1 FL=1
MLQDEKCPQSCETPGVLYMLSYLNISIFLVPKACPAISYKYTLPGIAYEFAENFKYVNASNKAKNTNPNIFPCMRVSK